MTIFVRNQSNPGVTAGDWVLPMIAVTSMTDRIPSTSAAVVAMPFYFPRQITVDNVRYHVVTGQVGAEIRCALYSNNGSGRPGALIADLGTGACTSSATNVDFAANSAVSGVIWVAAFIKDVATQATFRGPSAAGPGGSNLWQESDVLTGTFRAALRQTVAYPGSAPDPCTTFSFASSTAAIPMPIIQVAA